MIYSLREIFQVDLMLEQQKQKRKNELVQKYTLYCDMDGVLCDFKGRFDHYSGLSPSEYKERHGVKQFWKLIDDTVGEVFWSGMGWTPAGRELWNYIKDYTPSLLTSPSLNEVSRTGKQKWAGKNLSPTPRIHFKYSKEKKDLATPTSILIDDREDNIESWTNAGGIGIHHPENTSDISPVLNKLKELGYE